MHRDNPYFHSLNLVPGFGPLGFKKLLSYFSSLKEAWTAPLLELKRAGLEQKTAQRIISSRSQIDPESELQKILKQDIAILTPKDPAYPPALKQIYAPPGILYIRGEIKKPGNHYLAVVGTRKPSPYGKQATFQIVGLLAQANITVVSGMALGIDALAHQACLDFNGHTVAVLGGGVDNPSIYPRTNLNLAQKILAQNGALISEYPPGTRARPQSFPQRNRIISGLSWGVLIIEAAEKSGTLITARAALDQNREVFALPGSIYNPYSRGTNNLIKMGAKLITQVQDILNDLDLNLSLKLPIKKKIKTTDTEESRLLKHITDQPIHIDELTRQSKMSPAQISTALTLLEMKGMVRNVGSGNYISAD